MMPKLTAPLSLVRTVAAAAAVATLAAAPAFANNELDPGDTLAGIPADASASPCADASCQVNFDLPNSTLQVKTTADDAEATGTSATLSADFSVSAESGDPEDETKLVGSQVSLNVEAEGLLNALGADESASYRIDVRVTDLDDGVVVAAAKVSEDDEEDGDADVHVSELLVLPVMLTRGHSYRVRLRVTVAAAAGLLETASADFLMFDGFARWTDLTVIAGSDPFDPIDSLTERVDTLEDKVKDLEEDLDELRGDFDGHTHEYLTGRGTGHNNTTATTTTPENGGAHIQPVPVNPGGQIKKKGRWSWGR